MVVVVVVVVVAAMFHLLSPSSQAPGELGVQPPVGFWDPLGLSADGDTEVFKRRTSAEGETGCLPLLFCTYIVFEHYILGCPPLVVTVTTGIIPFLIGDPYKL